MNEERLKELKKVVEVAMKPISLNKYFKETDFDYSLISNEQYDALQKVCISLTNPKLGICSGDHINIEVKNITYEDNVRTNQSYVIPQKVRMLMGLANAGFPVLIKYQDQFVIEDGHHTLISELIRFGKSTCVLIEFI